MKRLYVLIASVCLALWGCSSGDPTLAVFKNVERIGEFPYSFMLEKENALTFVPDGALDIAISGDSLLFSVPSEKFIKVYDMKEGSFSGEFLQKGNGPYELLDPPFMQDMTITDGVVSIYDPDGHFFDFDYRHPSKNGAPDVVGSEELPARLKNCYRVDDSSYFCCEVRSDAKGLRRFILSEGREDSNDNIKILNKIVLDGNGDGYRHNLLSSLITYNKKNDIVVEAAMYQDVINLYSLHNTFAMSIVTGDNVKSIEELSTLPYNDFKDVYLDIRQYDNFFACLKEGNLVQFFGWNGEPLLQLKLPAAATSFDIAGNGEYMLAYDIEKEKLFKYEISKETINKLIE